MADLLYRSGSSHLYSGAETHVGGGKDCPFDAVYNIFFNSIVNNGRNVVECPLTYDGESYGVDFEKLERVIADPQTTMLIFCNPHNPVGKNEWEKETEWSGCGALCWKHHVVVISDEIRL